MSSKLITGLMTSLMVLFGLGSLESQQVAASDPDLQVLQRLAEERYAEGDLVRAAELYREIASKQSDPPARAKTLFTASWLLDLSGDRQSALETMTESLQLDPSQPFEPTLYNRPFELLYQQALDIALRERQRESAESTRQAMTAMRENRSDRARSLLERALLLDPDNPSALYHLALLDLDSGAIPEALVDLERVVALTYRQQSDQMTQLRAKALNSIGVIYHQQERFDDAEQSFLEATRADPTGASAWRNLGRLYLARKRYDAANTALLRAHELLPEDREITRALARSLAASGRSSQASSELAVYLQRHPDDAENWLLLAELEIERGQSAEAIRALERCMSADGQNGAGFASTAASRLARLHLEQGDFEAAMSAANQAVGWNRTDPEAWGVLGDIQSAAGQPAQAIASLNRAAELDPDSMDRQLTLAAALVADRQLPRAEAVYLKALTLDPGSTEASTSLEAVRRQLDQERAIVAGKAKPRKPVRPKKIGLEFAGIDYKDLQLRGALVKNVNKKSPAARAGLRKGDLILWIGDYSVLSDKDFMQFLKRNPPADKLEIEYLRDGRIHEAEIQLR